MTALQPLPGIPDARPIGESARPAGRLGNTNSVLIRHDYKRACYRAMLAEFSTEEVVEFFTALPLIIDEVRFYRLIEKLKEECPSVCVDKTGLGRFKRVVIGILEFQDP